MPADHDILPSMGHNGYMLRNVAAVIVDGFTPFELGVVCEVFGIDRSDDGLPTYDFAVVAGEPGPLRAEAGFTVSTPYTLDRLAVADLVVVPAVRDSRIYHPDGPRFPVPLMEALQDAVARGAQVLSVCTGAF